MQPLLRECREMNYRQRPQPTAALEAMLREDGELDAILSGRGLIFDNPPAPAVPPPPSRQIPPVDWYEEAAQREAQNPEPVDVEPQPERYPAKRKPRRLRTPNPDKLRKELAGATKQGGDGT